MDFKSKMQQKVAENPFYGKSAMKELLNQGKSCSTKMNMHNLLSRAWQEAKDNKELREGFFIICFSIAEISNRQHNIIGKKDIDNGGNAARPQGMWIMSWIRQNNPTQYYKFMFNRIINEFISWFVILACQIRTTKGKKAINITDTDTYSALKEHDLNKVAEYIAKTIKTGSIIDKIMLAKWLVLPRFSKRQKLNKEKVKSGSRELQADTLKLMKVKEEFLLKLSELMQWEVIKHKFNWEFKGLKKFKSEYNQSLESVLFATKKVKELDKEQFFNLLNQCPSGARYRIQRRLIDKDGNSKKKWFSNYDNVDLAIWYKEWEKFKEVKQAEVRVVEEKIKQGTATEKEVNNLAKLKNEAKVNTGAKDIVETVLDGLIESKDFNIELHSILEKTTTMPNIGIIKDYSSSTDSNSITYKGKKVSSAYLANVLLTYLLYKTNYDRTKNLVFCFGGDCKVVDVEARMNVAHNSRYFDSKNVIKAKVFNPEESFQNNLVRIANATSRNALSGKDGTDLTAWIKYLVNWADSNEKKELVASIPIWVALSDSDLNNESTATISMNMVMSTFERNFGVRPIIVVLSLVDAVDGYGRKRSDYFDGINGVIHKFGSNIGEISTIFKNISDIDIPDNFIELKSLWLSNRYTIIKENTL